MTIPDELIFGYPEFAATLMAAHGPQVWLAHTDSQLANEMLKKIPKDMNQQQIVTYMLVRMTAAGWVELLMLVGNGAGLGAIKIARGMFETAAMAEYLRRFPEEVEDYIEYSRVLTYKRMQQFPNAASPELKRKLEDEYNRVKPRFQDAKGRVRNQWNKHPISYMAEKVGRLEQYESGYSIAASIHHGNFEGLTAHLSEPEALDVTQPPSLEWIRQALVVGHIYLLQALDTLNDSLVLGFDSRLKQASDEFYRVWTEMRPQANP